MGPGPFAAAITVPAAPAMGVRISGFVKTLGFGGSAGTDALETNDPFTQSQPSALRRFTSPVMRLPL
ncbi:hypothetical protein [Kaistia terrae]|uniref:Uncharacterized protein n=1 Tax=Kaistia terrae TaxID=537017 RepID=A0ABW0PPH5_9HYPH|nr:hypothetical protein [Kaistia terrae]